LFFAAGPGNPDEVAIIVPSDPSHAMRKNIANTVKGYCGVTAG